MLPDEAQKWLSTHQLCARIHSSPLLGPERDVGSGVSWGVSVGGVWGGLEGSGKKKSPEKRGLKDLPTCLACHVGTGDEKDKGHSSPQDEKPWPNLPDGGFPQ